jgi:hypothetical protein
MKTKLTLNISSIVIEKAKKKAANKRTSLSAIVEDYLNEFSRNSSGKIVSKKRKTITQRIKEITKPTQISDSELKAVWHKHLDEKYGQ